MSEEMNSITGKKRDSLAELIRAAGHRATPPREDYEQVLAAATGVWQRKVRGRQRRRWAYALAAGVSALAIGVTALIYTTPQTPDLVATTRIALGGVKMLAPGHKDWQSLGQADDIAPGSKLRTEADGRAALVLASGTSVRLNSTTVLTLLSSSYVELLAGRIYVDSGPVAKSDAILISTAFGELRDIGTQFEVNAGPQGLQVRVREGEVRLEHVDQQPQSVVAGNQLSIDAAGHATQMSFRTDDPAWTWAEALAAPFNGRTVHEFLSWIARESGRRIRFVNDSVELASRTSTFGGGSASADTDLPPMEALAAHMVTTDFRYTLEEDGGILIRRR